MSDFEEEGQDNNKAVIEVKNNEILRMI